MWCANDKHTGEAPRACRRLALGQDVAQSAPAALVVDASAGGRAHIDCTADTLIDKVSACCK